MSKDFPKETSPQVDKTASEELGHHSVTWGPIAAVVVTVVIYFTAQLLGGILASLYPVLKGWTSQQAQDWFENSTAARLLLVLSIEAVSLLMLYYFLRSRKASLKMIGLVRPKLRDIGYALVGYAAYLPLLYIVAIQIIPNLFPELNVEQKQQIGFEQTNMPSDLALIFIGLVILVPITEEILIRGFLYSGLKARLSRLAAALTASALFGFAHLQLGSGAPPLWLVAADTFLLSLILIGLRELTGSLWASILLHMTKNGLAFFYLFILHVP